MAVKVLVAGVGNIFNGDDGFGVAVAQRLAGAEMPAGVVVRDIGIRGVHLAYELLDGYDALVLVDALPGDEEPGTLTVLAVDRLDAAGAVMDAHSMDPRAVLTMLEDLGGSVDRVLVVGCQTADVDERLGLSLPVEAAVDDAARLVHELVDELIGARCAQNKEG
ncbi:MAG: hydrogenase maturation protease [Acidimicrobiia bacterium]|nr:hydrogenase maturation protease [Acidimicrobiia bacterium]MBA3956441.1 hydrogenase maturation protease [Acidimicrobiia bacterium]